MFFWQDRRELPSGSLERCFTDSLGGVSGAPFSGLNLGGHVGDDALSVESNREALSDALGGAPISWLDQVHGREVVEVTSADAGKVLTADAQVTREAGLALAVMVADCTPVLLSDEVVGVVAAVHAGRPGMMSGVVPATVQAMRDLGASAIAAAVGPSICGRCYEVPADLRDEAARVEPASAAITWTGTPAIDVASGVVGQLAHLGVDVTWVPGCSREEPALYSYRRDGRTGRFAGLIVRRDVGETGA